MAAAAERVGLAAYPGSRLLLVDGHVHAYSAESLPRILASAETGFIRNAPAGPGWSGLLLLADPAGVDSKSWLEASLPALPEGWRVEGGEPPLLFHFRSPRGTRISVLRGQQLVTSEGLELLAIGADSPLPRGPLESMIQACQQAGCLAIVPWGVGKWLGRRGRLLRAVVDQHSDGSILLGENGGRPWFWPRESLMSHAESRHIPVLPGSDPLPLTGDELRVGSTGAIMTLEGQDALSVSQLLERLRRGKWTTFGRRMGAWHFMRNQLGLRLQARRPGSTGSPPCAS